MKTSDSKHKVLETVVGAAVGATIAGPAGCLAGGLAGHAVGGHDPAFTEVEPAATPRDAKAGDPMLHVRLKRILVPVDFSHPSRGALRFAREWALRFGSEVVLLHVIEPMNTYGILGIEPLAMPLPTKDYHEQVRRVLENFARQEISDIPQVAVHLRNGVAYDQIAIAARELEVDLIIIATHGRTGLAHALMGSTAEGVVRHAPCPVLTLRAAMHP